MKSCGISVEKFFFGKIFFEKKMLFSSKNDKCSVSSIEKEKPSRASSK